LGTNQDFLSVEKEDLAEKLRKFYCEATPKANEKRENHCLSITEISIIEIPWSTLEVLSIGIYRIFVETWTWVKPPPPCVLRTALF